MDLRAIFAPELVTVSRYDNHKVALELERVARELPMYRSITISFLLEAARRLRERHG